MNEAPHDSTPVSGPDHLDGQLRDALSAPEGVAERLVRQALRPHPKEAPPKPWRRGRSWAVVAATALGLTLIWWTSPLWRLSELPSESIAHVAEVDPASPAVATDSNTPRRHLLLSNTGGVVQLTAPSGNTLLVVASTPNSRR